MSQNGQDNMVTVWVDDTELKVPAGTNMIEAAKLAGIEVPHYCYHPKLSVAGNCRMCMVEMGTPMFDRATREPILDENGVQKIGWVPKPVIACATNASPGMRIRTKSDMVKGCREGVQEFLLVNHPLDCPICDQAGECTLQEFATDYGRGYSRFIEQKNVKPKRTRLGPRVTLDDERCILCSRCIRFSQEIAKDDVLGFVDRGSYSTLTCYPGKELANNYSLNTVDICPVGALTSTDFRFKMRVWFLKETKSICTESSVGVNTSVYSREGKIYRIKPRRNDEVNDTWMADSGRELYKQVESDDRLSGYMIEGQPASADSAALETANLLKAGKVAIVGSGRASVEEQFLLSKLARATHATTFLVGRYQEGDGLLISTDRNPNVRGALVTGLIDAIPEEQLSKLGAMIDAGEVDTIFVHGECLTSAGLSKEQLGRVKLIYLGSHCSPTCEQANLLLSGVTVFERSGSFINQQFRLQRFQQALPCPVGVLPDAMFLAKLVSEVCGETTASVPYQLWELMAKEVPVLTGLKWEEIGDLGVMLDSSPWASLSFREGETLHYHPLHKQATVEA